MAKKACIPFTQKTLFTSFLFFYSKGVCPQPKQTNTQVTDLCWFARAGLLGCWLGGVGEITSLLSGKAEMNRWVSFGTFENLVQRVSNLP